MFEIGNHTIGSGRTFIIGEVGQAHDGSLGMAHAFVDMIADAGADAVKFQTHIAAEESTADEPWRVKFSYQDASRYDYWLRMEFTEDQWHGLARHAQDRDLVFLSSPFSIAAVELLIRVGVPAWKIASGEVSHRTMLSAVAETGLPILLSSGMSSQEEFDRVVDSLKNRGVDIATFQCYSAYPCSPEKVGLNMMDVFRKRYNCPVGLSDHSGTIYPGLAAVMLGADMLEVHVTASRTMFGPDVPASLTPEELQQLVEGARFIERMNANPVAKDACAEELAEMRKLFSKSVVAKTDLQAGSKIKPEHVTAKKPGTGIPADQIESVIGKTLLVDIRKDQQLEMNQLS